MTEIGFSWVLTLPSFRGSFAAIAKAFSTSSLESFVDEALRKRFGSVALQLLDAVEVERPNSE